MYLCNSTQRYGAFSVLLHWLMALMIVGLFLLGRYIVDLDYYNAWYIKGPVFHLGLGVITLLLLGIRLMWRLTNPHPKILGKSWEQHLALWVHRLFYALIAAVAISGYFITTADGKPLSVFDWFDIPATFYDYPNQEDIAGEIHEWLANGLITLATFHSLAALKHHFLDRDPTLRRMLGMSGTSSITSKPLQGGDHHD